MLTLWAWLTYGGLGARTRRGFGQLVCTSVHSELPCGWTHTDLLPPQDADGWKALGGRAVPGSLPGHHALGWGELLPGPPPEGEPLPEFPTLAPRWWAGRVRYTRARSLGEALHETGLQWRQFRADDSSKRPTQSTHSPEWTHGIHGSDSRYPIAACGLPIGCFSHSRGNFNATVTPYVGNEQLRRASPVWLRPVLLSGGGWAMFTHVFYARLLPEGTELRIKGDKTAIFTPPPDDVVEKTWDRWIDDDPRLPDNYFPRRSDA